jgi:hypothetical protein
MTMASRCLAKRLEADKALARKVKRVTEMLLINKQQISLRAPADY